MDVYLASLADGHAVAAPVALVARDELIAVYAAGPRGDRARRTRTRPHPLLISAGPSTIRGHLHALPGAAPIASFHQRKPMVALTDAWIEYVSAGTPERYRLSTLIVNRERIDSVQLTSEEAEVQPPELPASESGPLTKDFTGQLLGFGRTGSRSA